MRLPRRSTLLYLQNLMPFRTFFQDQKSYLAQLTAKERRLLTSFFLFGLASPIFLVYTNTFLWRTSFNNSTTVILYNLGIYTGLSLGFLLNAALLRYVTARRLYSFACILQGIVPIVLVALVPSAQNIVVLLGLAFGISAGMYWANRNYFTSLMTRSAHQFSFFTLEQVLATVASIIAPAAIGWLIVYGAHVGYQVSVALGFILLLASGITASNIMTSRARQQSTHLLLRAASKQWNALRRMDFFNGLMNAVDMTIPLFAALTLVGMEDAIGTLQTISALAAALAAYVVGKKYAHTPRSMTLRVWLLIISLAGLVVTLHFTAWTIIFYTIVSGLMGPSRGAAINSILYKTIDNECNGDRSCYLLDREIFLNLGRVAMLAILAYLTVLWPAATVRIGFSAVIILRVLFVLAANTVDAGNTKRVTT